MHQLQEQYYMLSDGSHIKNIDKIRMFYFVDRGNTQFLFLTILYKVNEILRVSNLRIFSMRLMDYVCNL